MYDMCSSGAVSTLCFVWKFSCITFHSLIHRRIQNCVARLILKKRKTDHITPLFQSLHWLPIKQRIQYKINTLCYKCITGTAPSYLCDCLQLYTPSRTLRSASHTLKTEDMPCFLFRTAVFIHLQVSVCCPF